MTARLSRPAYLSYKRAGPRKEGRKARKVEPPATNVPQAENCKVTVLSSLQSIQAMLSQERSDSHLCTDGTYKVAPNGSTVATLGFFSGRCYVPVFWAILSGAKSGDTIEHWSTFLDIVRSAVGDAYITASVMRDHADCIRAALSHTFPQSDQRTCFFHVSQGNRKQRSLGMDCLADDATYRLVRNVVNALHHSKSEGEFLEGYNIAVSALLKKWVDYFFKKKLAMVRAELTTSGPSRLLAQVTP